MQAIQTKFLGATSNNGSRLKAKCQSGSITWDWNYSLSDEENNRQAALSLIKKMGWKNTLLGYGVLHDGSYAWLIK